MPGLQPLVPVRNEGHQLPLQLCREKEGEREGQDVSMINVSCASLPEAPLHPTEQRQKHAAAAPEQDWECWALVLLKLPAQLCHL